jgi:hypothetical protein
MALGVKKKRPGSSVRLFSGASADAASASKCVIGRPRLVHEVYDRRE